LSKKQGSKTFLKGDAICI